ncbi:GDCCVxC domain-containing (seleno)protein [Bosea sp. BIWAKO-01]|uniref:GDCCVxC domain-containing (seleno)protein n=1 Tax=Bosea sp. BIWAKO-01 TaxID=506668 RepID=UPI0009458D46|nr:GDCCVxC domain-containing (seleno)protein [Bosea sp. BIWAKO-01]
MQFQSTITCPHCAQAATETMPTDACQYFYECKGCGALLRPLEGDCCVYCSYGSAPCLPIQAAAWGSLEATRCCARPSTPGPRRALP